MNAAQVVAQRLFGKAIGPVFEYDDENSAPEGYSTEFLGSTDFDGDGLGDPALLFRRDPEAPPASSGSEPLQPECALILTLAVDDAHFEVYGVNPYELGCDLVQEDGTKTNRVDEATITVTERDVSFEVSYDPKERRFVLSRMSRIVLVDPTTQTGTFDVLRPLEGRGEVAAYPTPEKGDPQPFEFPIQRIYFEEIGSNTDGLLLGSGTSSSTPAD